MKLLDDGMELEIRFLHAPAIKIHRKREELTLGKKTWKFSEIKGFWKNYRFRCKKKVFYIVMLTEKEMIRLTPEIDEYDIDEIVKYLRETLGDDKYAR